MMLLQDLIILYEALQFTNTFFKHVLVRTNFAFYFLTQVSIFLILFSECVIAENQSLAVLEGRSVAALQKGELNTRYKYYT